MTRNIGIDTENGLDKLTVYVIVNKTVSIICSYIGPSYAQNNGWNFPFDMHHNLFS